MLPSCDQNGCCSKHIINNNTNTYNNIDYTTHNKDPALLHTCHILPPSEIDLGL